MAATETLAVVGSMIVGSLGAATGIYSVYVQNRTQLRTLEHTAEQQRRERLTAWRRERYGELLAAVGEFYGAVRAMNLELNTIALESSSGISLGPDDPRVERLHASVKRFMEVNLSGRILRASVQVGDKEVAKTAHKIADAYFLASGDLVRSALKEPRDDKELDDAMATAARELGATEETVYELNRRIEQLISAGE